MCLAVPARVVEIKEQNMADVEIGGVQRKASLALVYAVVGDYVILHAGIAISKLDEQEAAVRLKLFDELGEHLARSK
jgi:hydrogenase expression/formation protein HypC